MFFEEDDELDFERDWKVFAEERGESKVEERDAGVV